jgi:hypothetical protein
MQIKDIGIKQYIEIFLYTIITVGPFSPQIKMVLYFVCLLMSIRNISNLRKMSGFNFLLLCSMIVPMILDIRNIESSTPYSLAAFSYLAPFVFCLAFTGGFEKKEFIKKLEQVIFIICIISLIGFLVLLLKPDIINRFPTVDFYGRRVNTILVYGAIRDYTKINFLHRNCGLAFEPGAFQLLPNLGIAILIGDKEGKKDIKYWIKIFTYAITVLTTYSTTGFVILAILLLVSTFSNKKQFIIMVLVVILLSSALFSSYQYQLIKMQSGNFIDRFEESLYVIQNYGKYVFGIGSTGYDKIYSYNRMIGSWDTYTNLYLRFGLLFVILFGVLCVKLNKISFPICITIVLSLLTESIIGPVVVMLLYFAEQKQESDESFIEERIESRVIR